MFGKHASLLVLARCLSAPPPTPTPNQLSLEARIVARVSQPP